MTLLVVLILLTSALPDPGQPSFVPFMGGVGLFVGGLVAHARWIGIGVRGALWLLIVAMDRL